MINKCANSPHRKNQKINCEKKKGEKKRGGVGCVNRREELISSKTKTDEYREFHSILINGQNYVKQQ